MDMRQAWCLGFSVAITLAAVGSIATVTGGSLEGVLAGDLDVDTPVASDGADAAAFNPVIELPDVLQAGATTNVAVELIGIDASTPRGSQPMVQVELGLELVPAARGWIQLPRDRHLLAAEDLHRRSFALQVAPAAPCGTVPGRITVTVTAADDHDQPAQRGQVRRLLPPIACDQLPPPAPESLHAPADSCSDFDDDRPLAAVVVEPPGCNEPVRRPAPRPSTTPQPQQPEQAEQADDEDAAVEDIEPDEDDGIGDDVGAPTEDPADSPPQAPEGEEPDNGDGGQSENGGNGGGDPGVGDVEGGDDADGTATTSGSNDSSDDTARDTNNDGADDSGEDGGGDR